MPSFSRLIQKPATLLFAVLLLSVVPHAPYLWGYFFMDDFWHLAFLARGDYVWSTWRVDREAIDQLWYMSKPVFPQMAWVEQIQYYFRPVYLFLLSLDRAVFGYFGAGYHWHSQLWHSANAVLLVVLLRRLRFRWTTAAIAGMLFGLHPMAAEPVGWISARCYVHMTTFLLAATLCFLRFRKTGGAWPFVFHLIFLLLAFGSHEQAAAWAPALWAADFLGYAQTRDRSHARRLLHALPGVGLSLGFLFWRISDGGGPATWSMSTANFFTFKLFGPLEVSGYNLWHYARLFVAGIPPISFVYRPAPLSGADTWPVWILAAPVIALLLWKLRTPRTRLLLLLMLAMLFAVIWMPPSGRYLYGAMPAAFGLAALGIERLLDLRRVALRYLAVGVLALVVAWWLTASVVTARATVRSQLIIRDTLSEIVAAVDTHPKATDLYLMHIWPMMVSSPGVVPLLTHRPDLRVHLLTYASTLYHPAMDPNEKSLATLAFPLSGKWFEPMDIRTRRLERDKLLLVSEPEGFFTGPATFGWNSQQLPEPPEGVVHLPQFDVRFGRRIGTGGVHSLLFSFSRPLDDPHNLWMDYAEGHMRVWTPPPVETP